MALVNCFVSATHKVTSSSSTSTYAQWSSCVSKANTCFNNCTNPNPWAGKVLLWVDLINYFDIIQHGLLSYLLYCKSYILEGKMSKWADKILFSHSSGCDLTSLPHFNSIALRSFSHSSEMKDLGRQNLSYILWHWASLSIYRYYKKSSS